jgi:hypothetical protein
MPRILQRLLLLTAAGLAVCPAGCNPRERRLPETGATLEGTVSYGKDKVMVALVVAQGEGGSAQGFINEDGRYKLENVPLGEVHLAVNTEAGKGQQMSTIMAQSQGKARQIPKVIDVPAKYGEPSKSGITTTISKGENTYNIEIPK